MSTDPKKSAPTATVVAIGCRKYANVLPLTTPTSVLIVSPNIASTSTAGIDCRHRTRRRMVA